MPTGVNKSTSVAQIRKGLEAHDGTGRKQTAMVGTRLVSLPVSRRVTGGRAGVASRRHQEISISIAQRG